MIDYHMHTPFCRHARGTMDEYVEAAVAAGLEEIAFTPHAPLPGFSRGPSGMRMDEEELEQYVREVERLRGRFPGFPILCGLEADYYPGYETVVQRCTAAFPFDIVLMSVHFIRDWPGDSWVFVYHLPGKTRRQVYREYFQAMREGLLTGLFDCLAHFDLVKEPGGPVLDEVPEEVEGVLELCFRQGMSMEINTSGLRRTVGESYPAAEVIRLAGRLGVPLVTGSDAHDPGLVGGGFEAVGGLLESLPGAVQARYRGRVMSVRRRERRSGSPGGSLDQRR